MRELTKQEIDDAPEWATHFLVTKLDYVVWQSKYLEDLNYSGTCPYYIDCGLHIDAQPIPTDEEKSIDAIVKLMADAYSNGGPFPSSSLSEDDARATAKYMLDNGVKWAGE